MFTRVSPMSPQIKYGQTEQLHLEVCLYRDIQELLHVEEPRLHEFNAQNMANTALALVTHRGQCQCRVGQIPGIELVQPELSNSEER